MKVVVDGHNKKEPAVQSRIHMTQRPNNEMGAKIEQAISFVVDCVVVKVIKCMAAGPLCEALTSTARCLVASRFSVRGQSEAPTETRGPLREAACREPYHFQIGLAFVHDASV